MRRYFLANAAWVEGRELRQDAAIVVEDGIIRDIVSWDELEAAKDSAIVYNARMLLPGFINAHCHLEYSSFLGKLPRDGEFADWIQEIGALKDAMPAEGYELAARDGIRRLVAGGTTTVIDTSHRSGAVEVLRDGPLRSFVFWEVLALINERAAGIFNMFREEFNRDRRRTGKLLIGFGINPHAPYSVGSALRQLIKPFLDDHPDMACAWHVAEFRDEMRLFADGSGGLAEFFKKAKLPLPFDKTPECSPVEFLKREGLLDRCDMAFHLNFPAAGEEWMFAAPRAVVHCPGTHAYFKREPFPMWRMLNEGANVCLGTDSLASADTLSMFETLRMAGRSFPFLGGSQLLDLATRNAARARPLAAHGAVLGVIKRGAVADFVDIDPGSAPSWDLRDALLSPEATVAGTFVGGEKVH